MSRHRYVFKRAWWQKKRHAQHLLHQLRLWITDQVTDLKDIVAEVKERNK